VVAARASTGLWINITKIMHLVHGCWMVYGSTSRTSYWSMFFLFPLFSSIFLEPVTSFWQSERDDSRGPTLGFQSTRQSASVTRKKIWTLLNKFPSSQVGKSIEPWARFIVFLARADWHAILIHTSPAFRMTKIRRLEPSKKIKVHEIPREFINWTLQKKIGRRVFLVNTQDDPLPRMSSVWPANVCTTDFWGAQGRRKVLLPVVGWVIPAETHGNIMEYRGKEWSITGECQWMLVNDGYIIMLYYYIVFHYG
jgi:hypothetical protein